MLFKHIRDLMDLRILFRLALNLCQNILSIFIPNPHYSKNHSEWRSWSRYESVGRRVDTPTCTVACHCFYYHFMFPSPAPSLYTRKGAGRTMSTRFRDVKHTFGTCWWMVDRCTLSILDVLIIFSQFSLVRATCQGVTVPLRTYA